MQEYKDDRIYLYFEYLVTPNDEIQPMQLISHKGRKYVYIQESCIDYLAYVGSKRRKEVLNTIPPDKKESVIIPKTPEYVYNVITHHDPDIRQAFRSVHYRGLILGFVRDNGCTKVFYSVADNTYFEVSKDKGKCLHADIKRAIPFIRKYNKRKDTFIAFDITWLDDVKNKKRLIKMLQ